MESRILHRVKLYARLQLKNFRVEQTRDNNVLCSMVLLAEQENEVGSYAVFSILMPCSSRRCVTSVGIFSP